LARKVPKQMFQLSLFLGRQSMRSNFENTVRVTAGRTGPCMPIPQCTLQLFILHCKIVDHSSQFIILGVVPSPASKISIVRVDVVGRVGICLTSQIERRINYNTSAAKQHQGNRAYIRVWFSYHAIQLHSRSCWQTTWLRSDRCQNPDSHLAGELTRLVFYSSLSSLPSHQNSGQA